MVTSDINYKGSFDSIEAVWAAYPYGGIEGDYLLVNNVKYRWNKYVGKWENAEVVTETPARETITFDGDVNVQNDLTVAGVLRAKKFVVDDLPTGIEEVEITESAVSGGNNVITITYTNGESQTFIVKNGEAGKTMGAFGFASSTASQSTWNTAKNYLVPTTTEGEFNVYTYEDGAWYQVDTFQVDIAGTADAVEYDDTTTQLDADNVQEAIEALNDKTYPIDDALDETSELPVQNKVVSKEINNANSYLKGDVRTLAVGQTYALDEAVKTADGKMRRMTKEVKSLNLADVIAVGDLKSYNNVTYRALKDILEYDNTNTYVEGDYAAGRPVIVTITVDVSGFVQAGEISLVIGDVTPDNIQVTADSTAATIAADIIEAVGSIDGWTITDNEDGTITIQSNTAGASTLAFSYTDVDETGVAIIAETIAGATTISVYDGSSWSVATLANMIADDTLLESVDVSTLESYTQANDVMMDAMGTRTDDYPEFVKEAFLYISSATKISTSNGTVSPFCLALFRIKAGKTYTINQIQASKNDNQRSVAIIASEANFVNGGTIKQVLANGRTSSALFPTGIKYTPEVDEFLVIQGLYNSSVFIGLWFNAQVDVPEERNVIVDDDITALKDEVFGRKTYNAVTPIDYIKGASCDGRGITSKSDITSYLYKLEKGKTYNVYSVNYLSSYSTCGGVYELESPSHFMVGGGGVCKILTGSTINKTFRCTKDTYIVTKGYNANNNSNVYATCIVRELADIERERERDEILVKTIDVPSVADGTKRQLSPTGMYTTNNTQADAIYIYPVYVGRTYRISQTASANRVLACKWHGSSFPANMTMLDEIIAVGYPSSTNLVVVDYTPAEDCYILVQTNLASIVEIDKKGTKDYVSGNVDNRQVTRTDVTDIVINGSSQTQCYYQPWGFSWLERLNDILDVTVYNDGWSGMNFNQNLTYITDLSASSTVKEGFMRWSAPYKHRAISARYYLLNNSANGTPYGSTAYSQLVRGVRIVKSFGAKILYACEACLANNNVAYTRRAFSRQENIPFVSVLEELKMCYPTPDVGASTNRMPYGGWFYNQHLGYRAFALYERYIEMLERIPILKSVKMFKVRPMYKDGSPTIADLIYDDNAGRLQRFVGLCAGADSTRNTAQIDNLDNDNYKVAGGDNTKNAVLPDPSGASGRYKIETAAMKMGYAIGFNKWGLIEFILDRVKITKGVFQININTTPTNVYIAKVRTMASESSVRTTWESISYTLSGNLLVAKISRSDYDIQMDDKVRILIECEGAFALANPIFSDYNGKPKEYREESIEGYHERLYGAELNPQTGFPVDTHGWTLTGNAKVVALPSQIANYTAYNSYNSHLQLDDNAASATKTISIERGTSQVAIRVVCCVYPKIATTRFNVDGQVPEALQEYVANDAPQIRTYEYDYGTLALTVNDCAIRKALVWAGWAELYFEVDVPPTATSIKLQIGRETFTDASYNVNSWAMFVHDVSVQKIR